MSRWPGGLRKKGRVKVDLSIIQSVTVVVGGCWGGCS